MTTKIDWSGYTVEQIRGHIVALGKTIEYADSIKGKSNLVAEVERLKELQDNGQIELNNDDEDFDAEPVNNVKKISIDIGQKTELTPTSPEWNSHVLSFLTEDEKFDGAPTVDGLRRVTELVLGDIIYSGCKSIQAPNYQNGNKATVEYEVHIVHFGDSEPRIYRDIADAFQGNTDDAYGLHLSAVASTRAEGRALRKALKLRKIVAAEELTKKSINDLQNYESSNDPSTITWAQVKTIDVIAKRTNINAMALVNSGEKKYNSLNEVPFSKAQEMLKYLNKFQQPDPATGNIKEPPDDIRGYSESFLSNWVTK